MILSANPSAVTGYDDTKADLLNSVSNNYQYLSDTAGQIFVTNYYASTTATGATAGGVQGYVQNDKIKRGETGTEILVSAQDYFLRTVSGNSVAFLATVTAYSDTAGGGARASSFAYTWFAGTQQVESLTTSLPVVTAAQGCCIRSRRGGVARCRRCRHRRRPC